MNDLKAKVAKKALDYIDDDVIVGVGTGSTVNYFIDELVAIKGKIEGCVASSIATEQLLVKRGLPVLDLNVVANVPIYVDGADEVTPGHEMIKGGGGALTREKILASASDKFICIVDESKLVNSLGRFPVAVEVIPMARSYVARKIVKLGGSPEYREGFVTDNGNIILDVYNLHHTNILKLEDKLNSIPGVVDNGIFANRRADILLIARQDTVSVL